jgi:hypothetical protein
MVAPRWVEWSLTTGLVPGLQAPARASGGNAGSCRNTYAIRFLSIFSGNEKSARGDRQELHEAGKKCSKRSRHAIAIPGKTMPQT